MNSTRNTGSSAQGVSRGLKRNGHARDPAAILLSLCAPRLQLEAQGGCRVETHAIHASSVSVTLEHRLAKTDRLDAELLKRGFLGWLFGYRGHCKMVAV